MASEPTDQMLDAFNSADYSGCGNADWDDSHVRIGIAAVMPIVQRDTLRQVWDALVSPQASGLDQKATRIACAQVERIAHEMGVAL